MEELTKQYVDYVERLENIVYNHIAIKLATFKGFSEALKSDFEKTIKSFPLIYFIVESLQVDSVLTICKLTEENKQGKTIPKFINFTCLNIKTISKKYPTLTIQTITGNKLEFEKVKEQIKRVKAQRDKYYAHSDNEYFFEPNKLLYDFPDTYSDLVDITIILQNIISTHRHIIKGNWRVCMSDFAYLNTFKTIEFLKEASDEWFRKYRPDEKL